ncbi:MAG TPA: GNAT family N-acetyltransferase [Candidatus Sulfotelmatobacter sp.]
MTLGKDAATLQGRNSEHPASEWKHSKTEGLGVRPKHASPGSLSPVDVQCFEEIATSPRTNIAPSLWTEINREDVPLWDNILLSSNASLYQYPFWNEPQRPLRLRPRYLLLENEEKLLAYVCILTVGFGPAKIGLVFRGPVLLQKQDELPADAMTQLLAWARAQGYMFIRFTNTDAAVMSLVASAGDSRPMDAFPYFLDYPIFSPDYIVEQRDSEAETLAGFDREVRRKIRRATEMGYEFRCSDSPAALAGLWPLYQECARRKHFRLERPLSVYMEAMRMARSGGCAQVFAVYLNGRPVGSTLIFRDRDTAHCMLAAFEADHRQSAVFLHWNCMRYMYAQGATRYNMGPGPGTLARFKEQFSRRGLECPAPITLVLKEGWFRVWMKAVFPLAKKLRPILRGALATIAVEHKVRRRPASGRLQPAGPTRA